MARISLRTCTTATLVALSLVACVASPSPRDGGEGRFAIAVAPLSLAGLSDASYTLTVINLADQPVWSRTVSSSQYGDGSGSLTYVGTCDAGSSPNTVQLVVAGLTADGVPLTSGTDFYNPAPPGDPLELVVPCVANEDVAVSFDLTIARAAEQGFFDIGLDLQDLFCSAKLDCTTLLTHPDDGVRGLTAVLGFACTAGLDSDTHLLMDPVVVTCTGGGGGTFTIDPSLGPGQLDPTAALFFQAATYRGAEALGSYHKAYWNVALGLDPTAFAALSPCTVTASATVSDGPFAANTSPAGVRWPYVDWVVPLVSGSACTPHEVGGGDGVAILYGPSAGKTFHAQWDVDGDAIALSVDPLLATSLRFDDVTDTVSVPLGTTLGTTATIEAWVQLDPATAAGQLFSEWTEGVEDKQLSLGPTAFYTKYYPNPLQNSAAPITVGVWHHVAWVMGGGTQRLYLDGLQVASQAASTNIADAAGLPFVGAHKRSTVLPSFRGYLAAIRVTDTELYTGASFTAPGPTPTAVAGTLLLYTFDPEDFYVLGGDVKVVDHSGRGADGTLGVGFTDATSPPTSPTPPPGANLVFDPRLAHSVYFDALTDTIRVPTGTTLAGRTSTYEAWIMLTGPTDLGLVFNEWADGAEDKFITVTPTSVAGFNYTQGQVSSAAAIGLGGWHHVAFVQDVVDSSNVAQRLYLDGALIKTQTVASSAAISDAGGLPYLGGRLRPTLRSGFRGYLDALRISKVARYTGASFTPPGRDLASDANTLILYNFEPSQFYQSGSTRVQNLGPSGAAHDGQLGGSAADIAAGLTAPTAP